MDFLNLIRNGIGKLLEFSGLLAGLMLVIISLMITWGAIARYMLMPAHWVEPFSIYLFIASSFLGAAYAMKKKEHINVDILIRLLPTKVRKVIELLTSIVALCFFIYLTWRSFEMIQQTFNIGTTDLSLLQIPLWIPQSFVLLGAILMCLSLIWHMINIFLNEEPEDLPIDKVIH